MKIKKEWVLGIIGTLIVMLLGWIGKTVWDGVQIAERTEVRVEMMEKAQEKAAKTQEKSLDEVKGDVKELRRELYAVYPVLSDLAVASDVEAEVR
jgi:predicted negative regulator of RcsB-dependent stress response